LQFASHIGHNVIQKEEKKAYHVEKEVVFEKEYSMRCSTELLETDVP
jgi:hypothetical protein